jgi:hypothetical protein
MVDRIGSKYGYSKRTSDAPSEWWHIKHEPSIQTWHGPDPGPYGQAVEIPKPPEGTVALAVATMKDGRFEVFVEDKNGGIWHAWQDKNGGWAGAEAGKRNAGWYSLGQPGKK